MCDIIREGLVKKGGLNSKPRTNSPSPPKGQGGIKREEINKKFTFSEARSVMRKAFEDKPALLQLYTEMTALVIHNNRIFVGEAYEANLNKAEKVIEKIFFEER